MKQSAREKSVYRYVVRREVYVEEDVKRGKGGVFGSVLERQVKK